MENISPVAWKILIEVSKGTEKFNINTPTNYQELLNSLRVYQIYSDTILEYFNDAGDKVIISNDKEYYNFLASSNGFLHFLDCKVNKVLGSEKSTTFNAALEWKCINCFMTNKPSETKCTVCKDPRT